MRRVYGEKAVVFNFDSSFALARSRAFFAPLQRGNADVFLERPDKIAVIAEAAALADLSDRERFFQQLFGERDFFRDNELLKRKTHLPGKLCADIGD